ncbi:MAG: hypothetical protein IMW88_03860 [Thermoflavifilum sp.]|uniref:hypothetical protein n=1 Tax=Thermoflavifilum sp. TaxID=1968839 RepID=UPI0018A5F5F3|nr:hypothetical protein [Thermoflavifilum sp.]QOR76683.1 MAG: hypothetical protein IMW88_03860 [Thermoflavifilum sp.]
MPAATRRGQEAEEAALAAMTIGAPVGQRSLHAVGPRCAGKVNHGAGHGTQAAVVDHGGKDGHRIVGENKQLPFVRHIGGVGLGVDMQGD